MSYHPAKIVLLTDYVIQSPSSIIVFGMDDLPEKV